MKTNKERPDRDQQDLGSKPAVAPDVDVRGYRTSVVQTILGAGEPIVALICAEEGLGRTDIILRIGDELDARGTAVHFCDLKGLTYAEMVGEVETQVRWAGRRRSESKSALISFDNVPTGDESEMEQLVKHVRHAVRNNVSIILGMCGDSYGLSDLLVEATCYRSCDIVRERPEDDGRANLYDRYTHGIALLERETAKLGDKPVGSLSTNPSYLEVLTTLVESCLRPQLMAEERAYRLGALLLGSGKREELERVCLGADESNWLGMACFCPLLGINVSTNAFSCVGSHTIDSISAQMGVLASASVEFPAVVEGAVEGLVNRGDYERAALVSNLHPDIWRRCELAVSWGIPFINAGQVSVVENAVEILKERGGILVRGYIESSQVLEAVTLRTPAPLNAPVLDEVRETEGTRIVQHILAMRYALRAKAPAGVPEQVQQGRVPQTTALHMHLCALSCITSCRFSDAQVYALGCEVINDRMDVSLAVTLTLRIFCETMLGGVVKPEELQLLSEACAFLDRSGLMSLMVLVKSVIPLAHGLMGDAVDQDVLERGARRAQSRGDWLLYALFMLAGGISDLMQNGQMRAQVRFRIATESFKNCSAGEWERVARILLLATRAYYGEGKESLDFKGCRGAGRALDAVVNLLEAAITTPDMGIGVRLGRVSNRRCPEDIFWLVCVLSRGFGPLSNSFVRVLPTCWRNSVLSIARTHPNRLITKREASIRQPVVETSDHPILSMRRVEVDLLGRFVVRVEGVALSSDALDGRRSKTLLALLSAAPAHALARFEIMESVWPTYDFHMANKCLSSSVSNLRHVLGDARVHGRGHQLVITAKGEGKILLNEVNFAFDSDEFEERARQVIEVQDSEDRVRLSREAETLYKGDLYLPPLDGAGIVSGRRQQLKNLFVDVMTLGAEAAIEEDQKVLACRFAQRAHEADPLREDVMKTLVHALCAAGRGKEAELAYDAYIARVVDETRKLPSRSLREDVARLLGEEAQLRITSEEDGEDAEAWDDMRIEITRRKADEDDLGKEGPADEDCPSNEDDLSEKDRSSADGSYEGDGNADSVTSDEESSGEDESADGLDED